MVAVLRRARGDGGRGDRGTDLFRLEAGHAGEVQAVLEPGQDAVLDRLRGPAGHRPPRGLLHLRRRGQAPHRRPPQRRHLQPGPPQPGGGRRRDRGHAALRHRQPPLPLAGPHRAGRGADQHGTGGPRQGDVRQRRRGGHRHRAEERAARDGEARHRLGGQGLSRAHRAGRGHRRRAVRDLVPGRPARRVHPRAVQRPGRDGGGAARPGRGRGDHGDDPGHLRLPAARARLPGRGQAAVRALRRALHRRRGPDRPDAYRRAVGDQQARRRPGHPGLRQGHLRRHVPGQRGAGHRGRRGLADRGRVRAHVHVRRRRARLRGRAQDAGDHLPARGQVDGALHRGDLHRRAGADPGHLPGLVHRHPAGRAGHGPGVRPPARRQVRHEAAVRERGVGDLLHPRPPRAAVQAGHPAHPGALRGTARADRGGHRQGP